MKKRNLIILGALIFMGIVMSSCRSRQPHCPGVYSKTTTAEQPKNV